MVFLRELRDQLAKQGVSTSMSCLSRFFRRHRITRKKGLFTQPRGACPLKTQRVWLIPWPKARLAIHSFCRSTPQTQFECQFGSYFGISLRIFIASGLNSPLGSTWR